MINININRDLKLINPALQGNTFLCTLSFPTRLIKVLHLPLERDPVQFCVIVKFYDFKKQK